MMQGMRTKICAVVLFFFIAAVRAQSGVPPNIPPNIIAYVPIALTNYQNSAVAANTPIAIGTNANGNIVGFSVLEYSQYYTCNLDNAEFFFANGTIAKSWLEGNILDEQAANALCTSSSSPGALADSANILYWVLIPTNAFLPANTGTATTNTLYLGWAGNVLTPANNLMDKTVTGEAPELSSSYGEYDNGADVFSLYNAFGSLTSLPAGWSTSNSLGVTFTTANMLMYGTTVYQTAPYSYNTPGNVIDLMLNVSNYNPYRYAYVSLLNNVSLNPIVNKGVYLVILDNETPTMPFAWDTNGGAYNVLAPNSILTKQSVVFSLALLTQATASVYLNYSPVTAVGAGAVNPLQTLVTTGPTYFEISASDGADPFSLYWIRTRINPPNDIMPSTGFESVMMPQSSIVLSSCPSSSDLDAGQSVSCTTAADSLSGPFTYNWLISNSITGAVTANMLYTGATSTSNTFAFQTTSADAANSPERFNVIVSNAVMQANSVYSTPFATNPAFNLVSFLSSPPLPATVNVGQTVNFTATVSGGTPGYTYNFIIANTATGMIVGNYFSSNLFTSKMFTWTVPASLAEEDLEANVIVRDSAQSKETANSIYSSITVNALTTNTTSTPIIPPNRTINWSMVGIPGGIPSVTTVCANVKDPPYNAIGNGIANDTGAIIKAINACPNGTVVYIPAGTYTIVGGWEGVGILINKSIVLRGAGPDKTHIILGSNRSRIYMGVVPGLLKVVNWTGGYQKGDANIIVQNTIGMSVGQLVQLDELNDPSFMIDTKGTEDGEPCSRNGTTFNAANNYSRCAYQIDAIKSINTATNTITLDTPLYFTYLASLNPQVAWATDTAGQPSSYEYEGIENMSIQLKLGKSTFSEITFSSCKYCWASTL